jgi:hypothetical protein
VHAEGMNQNAIVVGHCTSINKKKNVISVKIMNWPLASGVLVANTMYAELVDHL